MEKFKLMTKRIAHVFLISFFLIITGFLISSFKHSLALTLNPDSCDVPTEEECSDLLLTYSPGSRQFARTQVSGSLLGISNFMQGASSTQPAPANLAYWWNDNVNRIPFAGRALAAPISYSGPFLQIILGVWKLARDVSYGVMALVMLVIGFMIITRKKIGPQAAVTAQQALPRIIIALILITFSYPIGAIGASAAFVLRGNASSFIQGISWGDVTGCTDPNDRSQDCVTRDVMCKPDQELYGKINIFSPRLDIRRTVLNFIGSTIFDGTPFMASGKNGNELAACGAYFLMNPDAGATESPSIGKLGAIMFAVMGSVMGNGALALIIVLVVWLASIVFGILVYIKFFMLYLKLLFSIIGAPLQFAFGAIPGNETVTSNWFKSFVSIVISIPAMFFVLDLAWQLAFHAIGVALAESYAFGGGTLMLLIIPFIYIFGANFARQVPDKIDAMIIGEKKGGKR